MIEKIDALAPEEVGDAVLNKVKHFTVGFARAGDESPVKGSGVLVKYRGLHGILTAAHVEQLLREITRPVGLVRLNRGPVEQFGMLDMAEVFSYAAGADPWPVGGDDLAFIHLPPHLVGNIDKDGVFLDANKNFTKPEPNGYPSPLIRVHSVFGLVQDFTGRTTCQNGRATTLLKGVLTSGNLRDVDALNATLVCFEDNLSDLPKSFGGTSGGGLWRVHVQKHEDGSFEAVHHRLIGIASSEDVTSTPPRWVMCQGIGRIEAMLEDVHCRIDGKEMTSAG